MSFCSFFGGEVFQNHFEPGTPRGIKAYIASWGAVEFPNRDWASVVAEEKRAWEKRTHSVDQAGFELRDPLASASRVKGVYVCAKCSYELFSSHSKYAHSSPWPAFTETIHPDSVTKCPEKNRPEALKVSCGKCGNGLGHEFLNDGPKRGQSRF